MKKIIFLTLIFLVNHFNVNSQNISVVHIQGDVKVIGTKEAANKAKAIVYGPIKNGEKILLSNNSRVRLLKTNNEICDLSKAGIYDISALQFINLDGKSVFGKFCDYFHSFFINHSSSESKASYKNNIYAISRGDLAPTVLDFPLQGILPIDAGSINFSWSHSCDTCHYIFSIYDFENKNEVYSQKTNVKQLTINESQKFLLPSKKYYWNVKLKNLNEEYHSNSFTTSKLGDFDQKILSIKSELENDDSIWMDEMPKTIYIMSVLLTCPD